jgi:D-glycero-alpha-D-manno-heptose 1-phosphate guanylyltransferase
MTDRWVNVSAAILAGGLGTRLRPVVADRPKVLAPIGGRPFLSFLLDNLEQAGIREAVLLVGFGADQVRTQFGDRYKGIQLLYSMEPEPLGTAGAVKLAAPLLRGHTVLLLNGDSHLELDLGTFLRFHSGHGGAGSIALASVENASRFGRVVLGAGDRIWRFEEKDPAPAHGWINAGLYLFRKDLLEGITPGRAVSLERDVMPRWVEAGHVFGFRGGSRFIDIGVPESYASAAEFFADCRTSRLEAP